MKKLILPLLIALTAITVWAADRAYRIIPIMDGTGGSVTYTNGGVIITNTAGLANVVGATSSIATNTATTSTTNANGVIQTTISQSARLRTPIVTSSSTVGVSTSFKLVGAGTSAASLVFDKSYDGTNWEQIAVLMNVTAAGTTVVSGWTNITVGDFGYFRVRDFTNGNSVALTNLYIIVTDK